MTELIQKSKINDEISSMYVNKMRSTLQRIYNDLSGDNIDLVDIKSTLDMLKKYNKTAYREYLDTLLHPEIYKGIKIPSSIPVPSCVFPLHNSFTLTTSNTGNIRWLFNPNFLYNKDKNIIQQATFPNGNIFTVQIDYFSTFFLSNGNSYFRAMNVDQGIPGVYKSFRVVSASVVMKYIGRLDESSGYMGGAIVYDDISVGCRYKTNNIYYVFESDNTDKYNNTDLANNAFYNQEVKINKGIRMIYFPIDNSYEEYNNIYDGKLNLKRRTENNNTYIKINQLENKNFIFYGYVNGAPKNSTCIKIDFYINFECLPDSSFLNYMPVSVNPQYMNEIEKGKMIKKAQEYAVSTLDSKIPNI